MDKIVEFLGKFAEIIDKSDPVITIILAGLNIWIVYRVYRFTQKMSQSKLSLSPESRDRYLPVKEKKEIEQEFEWAERNKNHFVQFHFKGEGFPIDVLTSPPPPKIMSIRVKNRGDLPSTKVKIVLRLKIYKTRNIYDTSVEQYDPFSPESKPDILSDIVESKRQLHITRKYIIPIDYIGADEERVYELFNIDNDFRESELILDKIQANGYMYFKKNFLQRWLKPTIINHYKHPKLSYVGVAQDAREVYGHKSLWEEGVVKQLREESLEKAKKEIIDWM